MKPDLLMLWREQQNATFPYAARDLKIEGTTLLLTPSPSSRALSLWK